MKNASEALARAKIREAGFESMIDLAKEGDVVYCDLTDTVARDRNGFDTMNEASLGRIRSD